MSLTPKGQELMRVLKRERGPEKAKETFDRMHKAGQIPWAKNEKKRQK